MNDVIAWLSQPDVVGKIVGVLDLKDIAEILKGRESAEFEVPWLDAFNRVSQRHVDVDGTAVIDRLRKAAFIGVYSKTNDSELAAYISDDMELIARGLIAPKAEPVAAALLKEYLSGRVPSGALHPSSDDALTLSALIKNLST